MKQDSSPQLCCVCGKSSTDLVHDYRRRAPHGTLGHAFVPPTPAPPVLVRRYAHLVCPTVAELRASLELFAFALDELENVAATETTPSLVPEQGMQLHACMGEIANGVEGIKKAILKAAVQVEAASASTESARASN